MKPIFILPLLVLVPWFNLFAQFPDWQHKDLEKESVFGISAGKAYAELLNTRKPAAVLVAVIDDGVDTAHAALKTKRWKNPQEVRNGKDDDGNGYIDDVYGWNFIGGKNGNVEFDNLELTRLIRADKAMYDSLAFSDVPVHHRERYRAYRELKKQHEEELQHSETALYNLDRAITVLDTIVRRIGKENPSLQDFHTYGPRNALENKVKQIVLHELQAKPDVEAIKREFDMHYRTYQIKSDYHLNLAYDPREIISDDYQNKRERIYGNSDVSGPDAGHGTHVSGIIAAERNDDVGMSGIASNVRIMPIRAIPKGDERDKDVANAIRYAVDNGARIINMSFGKPYSPDKEVVDEAVRYAMQRDVLIVHAAGNDAKNLEDPESNVFPNKYYADSTGQADAWITVGASGLKDDSTLVAPFSNYGKTWVDVFAPGVQIYSTIPGSKYEYRDGTSMAAPVVSGIAALLWGHNPELTALQVKEIIMKSVTKRDVLKDKCVTGGVVNAYLAMEVAEEMVKD